MSYHQIISDKITYLLDNIYYNNLKKLYNEKLDNIFIFYKYPILKPEFFVYLQYYFIYTFFYYVTNKNFIFYSISLHLTHINGLIFKKLISKYEYKPTNNIYFLKDTSYLLFVYLLFFKILFLKIVLYKKIFLSVGITLSYMLFNTNYIYNERLKYIEQNKEITNNDGIFCSSQTYSYPLKFLIISPNITFIKNIINKTKFFTYSNYLFIINILIYLFI